MVGTAVPTVVVGTVVPTVIVGTGVPTRVVGTAANTFFVPAIIVGTIVNHCLNGLLLENYLPLMVNNLQKRVSHPLNNRKLSSQGPTTAK